MANTIIIRNNEWNVHINFNGIDDETLGGIIREIVTENFYWENFCKCDDLWFDDGRIAKMGYIKQLIRDDIQRNS